MAYTFGTPAGGVIYTPPTSPALTPLQQLAAAKKNPWAGAPQYDASGRITGYGPLLGSQSYVAGGLPGDIANNSFGLPSGGTKVGASAVPVGSSAPGGAAPVTDPNADFSVLNKTKNPSIAAAAANLQGTADTAQTQESKSFSDYLKEATDQAKQNSAQLTADRTTFNTAPGELSNDLAKINANFKTSADNTDASIAAANAAYKQQSQQTLADMQAQNDAYAAAAGNVAAQAIDARTNQNKIFQAGSGTPTSAGGGADAAAIQAVLDVNTPLQADLANRRLELSRNVELPLEQQYQGQDVSAAQYGQGLAGQEAGMSTAAATTVANLKTALAGRSLQESITYMNQLAIPMQLQQALLNGSISVEQALSGLDQSNTFYGLTTPYTMPTPTLPDYSPRAPTIQPSRSPDMGVPPLVGRQPMGGGSGDPQLDGLFQTSMGHPYNPNNPQDVAALKYLNQQLYGKPKVPGAPTLPPSYAPNGNVIGDPGVIQPTPAPYGAGTGNYDLPADMRPNDYNVNDYVPTY